MLRILFQRGQHRSVHEPGRDVPEQRRGLDFPDQQGRPRRQGHVGDGHSRHQER